MLAEGAGPLDHSSVPSHPGTKHLVKASEGRYDIVSLKVPAYGSAARPISTVYHADKIAIVPADAGGQGSVVLAAIPASPDVSALLPDAGMTRQTVKQRMTIGPQLFLQSRPNLGVLDLLPQQILP
jgi:hypothetical protein